MQKYCPGCGLSKNKNEFYGNRRRPDGLNSCCIACSRKRSQEYQTQNREKLLAYYKERNKRPAVVEREKLRHLNTLNLPTSKQGLLDRLGKICCRCGKEADNHSALEIDHVVPRSSGGANAIENYQLLCKKCNAKKGNKIIDYRGGGILRGTYAMLFNY